MATKTMLFATKNLLYSSSRHHSLNVHAIHNSRILQRHYVKIALKHEHTLTKRSYTALRQIIQPKYIVHCGNLLAVCALLQSDMLYLRSFMIGASACGIAFNLLQPIPLIAPAYWGLFFMMSHSVQIYYLLRDQLSATIPHDLNEIYETSFVNAGFTPRQFLDLFNEGNYECITYKKGENIEYIDDISWLMKGRTVVRTKKSGNIHIIDDKSKSRWIGDVFHKETNKTYQCLTDCKVLRLNRKKIEIYINENDNLKEKTRNVMMDDICIKYKNMEESNILNSYTTMIGIYVRMTRNNEESEVSDDVKKYLKEFSKENDIDREYIDLCLRQNHGLKYEEVFK